MNESRLVGRASKDLIETSLREDDAFWDITTSACVDADAPATARFVAREQLILCGTGVAEQVFDCLGNEAKVEWASLDGDVVRPGQEIGTIGGPARAVLSGERVALNFLQRLSGIATATHRYVDAAQEGNPDVRITETRKTTPGHRQLERYAVRCGGGSNHRPDLGAAVMIKDNHIAIAGSVGKAIRRARSYASHMCVISCEVESLDQAEEALAESVDILVLDNFETSELADAVSRLSGRAVLEVTGGVTLANVRAIAATGVDVISIGALTQKSPAVDIGLDMD